LIQLAGSIWGTEGFVEQLAHPDRAPVTPSDTPAQISGDAKTKDGAALTIPRTILPDGEILNTRGAGSTAWVRNGHPKAAEQAYRIGERGPRIRNAWVRGSIARDGTISRFQLAITDPSNLPINQYGEFYGDQALHRTNAGDELTLWPIGTCREYNLADSPANSRELQNGVDAQGL
jgi:hypothetical protein